MLGPPSENLRQNLATTVNPRIIPRIKTNTERATLVPIGSTFRGRWFIKGMIGQGGYGEVYYVKDTKTNEDVALKVEPRMRRNRLSKRMMLEQRVLVALRGKPHSPFILGSGHEKRIHFLVLQLLSVNLGDLRKASPVRKLSKSTVGRVMVQAIAALRELHATGYVHRDVKPANMCFGLTPSSQHRLILLDYGLVRRYLSEDGSLRPPRRECGFRGTLRYVSPRVHHHLEQAPLDDLISLLYTGFELLLGELPWKFVGSTREIRRLKEELVTLDFVHVEGAAGEAFCDFGRSVASLEADDEPDYSALQSILGAMYHGRRLTDPYDWDCAYCEADGEHYRTAAVSPSDAKIDDPGARAATPTNSLHTIHGTDGRAMSRNETQGTIVL